MQIGREKEVIEYPERAPLRRAIPITLPKRERKKIPVPLKVPEKVESGD